MRVRRRGAFGPTSEVPLKIDDLDDDDGDDDDDDNDDDPDQDDDDGGLQGRRSTSQTWCLARRKIKLTRGSSSSPGEVEQRAGGTCEKVGRDRHHMCPVQCLWQHHSGRGC